MEESPDEDSVLLIYKSWSSSSHGPSLLSLAAFLFSLFVKELSLLFSCHVLEPGVPLILLALVTRSLQLLSLLVIISLFQLAHLIVTSLLDTAHDFRSEVSVLDKLIGHAKEVVEDGHSRLVGAGGCARRKTESKRDALLGQRLIEPSCGISIMRFLRNLEFLLLWLINWLVCYHQSVERLASLFNGLDELRSQQGLGDLSVLRHHSSPWR